MDTDFDELGKKRTISFDMNVTYKGETENVFLGNYELVNFDYKDKDSACNEAFKLIGQFIEFELLHGKCVAVIKKRIEEIFNHSINADKGD